MIISASRRTDIPAFFSEWFMTRLREGYSTSVNPFNSKQVTYVSLDPNDVDVIVFWTKNPRPLLPHLSELVDRGYRFYFQFTVTGYPAVLESKVPPLEHAIECFEHIQATLGPGKVIWRYDPLILSNLTPINYHQEKFQEIAERLHGLTDRVVVSLVDNYRKAAFNFKRLEEQGLLLNTTIGEDEQALLFTSLATTARSMGLEIQSCAEPIDLNRWGITPGKCIDPLYINKVFGLPLSVEKDKNQRLECGCAASKDIGAYDSCLHGCSYCYACTLKGALRNLENHDVTSPSLLGHYDCPPPTKDSRPAPLRLF